MGGTRTSFRPRPLDVHKQLGIVRDVEELDQNDEGVSRPVHHGHAQLDAENEEELVRGQMKKMKKIPIPEVTKVATYETDYRPTFQTPVTYLRAQPRILRPAFSRESAAYDLNDPDERWLHKYNGNQNRLSPEKFELMLNTLEVACQVATERYIDAKNVEAGDKGTTSNVTLRDVCSTPDALSEEEALSSLKSTGARLPVLQAVYAYWKERRMNTGQPILRHFWPPPPTTDVNPYTVFRPRERAQRPQTRRRRENDFASYEKLKEIRKNLEASRNLLHAIVKRERRKMDISMCNYEIQMLQVKLHHEPKQLHDMLEMEAAASLRKKERSRQEDLMREVRKMGDENLQVVLENSGIQDSRKQLKKKRKDTSATDALNAARGSLDPPQEPDIKMHFVGPINLSRLACFMNVPPEVHRMNCKPRIGRGGRIIFDRCDPLSRQPFFLKQTNAVSKSNARGNTSSKKQKVSPVGQNMPPPPTMPA